MSDFIWELKWNAREVWFNLIQPLKFRWFLIRHRPTQKIQVGTVDGIVHWVWFCNRHMRGVMWPYGLVYFKSASDFPIKPYPELKTGQVRMSDG